MLVLGIESTCDETGCALVCDGKEILANQIASQEEIHAPFGGVIPELACRMHIDVCTPLVHQALHCANKSIEEIDLVAVAKGPGLIGALLIGLNFAKGLALSLNKPLVGVNHIEAHLYSAMMEHTVSLPAIGVVVSGGHTSLVKIEEIGHYTLIGQTHDDAIGEAFDKVAKILGLPYPGGPQVEKLALEGNPYRYAFKSGHIKDRPFDFSFSGLKTAVLYLVKGQNGNKNSPVQIQEKEKADVAASFQHIVFSSLVQKILDSAKEYSCRSIVLGGGVSQNGYLRTMLNRESIYPVHWPSKALCLDNAAMIAGLGYHVFRKQGEDSLHLSAKTRIPFN